LQGGNRWLFLQIANAAFLLYAPGVQKYFPVSKRVCIGKGVKNARKRGKYMIGMRRMATITLVVAGLIVAGFIGSGCKKTEPGATAPSSPAQQSASVNSGSKEPEVIPQEALRHVQQGLAHIRSHEYDSAIGEYTTAIEQYPRYVMAYNDRAAAYVRQKKFDKAKDDLTKALAIDPHNPITYYNTAALYALQKQTASALDYLDKALALGFKEDNLLRSDPDLNNIRKTPEFKKILERNGISVSK
jgi:tetratricopeptide (TPR) repeat protein